MHRNSFPDAASPLSAAHQPRLFVVLLGHLQVEVDGAAFVLNTRRKTLPLLAYLLLHRHENLARDYVAYLLWPDESEESALTKLRSNLHELAKSLPPSGAEPWLRITGNNVRWNPDAPLELDVERFVAAAEDPQRLDEAMRLYTSDLLEGVDEEWVIAERERLQRLLFTALERGIARAAKSGDLNGAVGYGQRLLARDPFREDVLRRVMTLRDAAGDRSGALAEYRRFEAHIRRELAVDPMPETIALRDQIARGEAPFFATSGDDDETPRALKRGTADSAPLVGRESELERLAGAWSRTRARRGTVLFVGGEAGIGKSRLVAHVARDFAAAGGRVIAGSTSPPEAGPYQAFVEALRSALPLVAALRMEPLWRQSLATLVPELGSTAPGPALPTLAAGGQADRVHEAITRALVALATTRPLVVILEDLHWASAATVEALRSLARRIALVPVLVVVTFRDDETGRAHPLASALRELAADGLAESLPVRALEVEDVAEMARRAGVPAERAAAIHRTTGGNAFFISQLLACDASDSPSATVPDGVFEAVAARFERLPEDTRHVAEIAALAGTHFSREILCDVAGWSAAEIADALDDLIDRRFVRERLGRGPFNVSFAHELVRQTILRIAPGSPERHRRVARVIETCHPELAGELGLDLAAHYERAGAPLEAARRYFAAARRALDLGAVADAESALARGLALDIDARTRADLIVLAIEAGARGDLATQLARIDLLERLASELGDADLGESALEARADLLLNIGDDRRVAEIASVMRERATERGERRWLAVTDLIDAKTAGEAGDDVRAFESATRALAAFDELGDERGVARCQWVLARLAIRSGDVDATRRRCADLEIAAERAGDYHSKLRAIVAKFVAAVELCVGDDATVTATRWIALATEAGDRREEATARDNHSHALLLAGRGGAAIASSITALGIAHAIGIERGRYAVLANHASNALKLGAFVKAIEIFESVLERRRESDADAYRAINLLSQLGLARAYGGDPAGARESGLAALAICERFNQPLRLAEALSALTEIARAAGDHDAALKYASRAVASLESIGSGAHAKSAIAAALAAAQLGQLDDARERLAAIPDTECEVFAGTYWRERTALQLAQAARLCGNQTRAERWLAIAEREIATTLEDLAEPWRSAYRDAWWSHEIARMRSESECSAPATR